MQEREFQNLQNAFLLRINSETATRRPLLYYIGEPGGVQKKGNGEKLVEHNKNGFQVKGKN